MFIYQYIGAFPVIIRSPQGESIPVEYGTIWVSEEIISHPLVIIKQEEGQNE